MNRVILGILFIYICVFSGSALSAFDFPTHLNFMLKNLHAQAQTNNKPVVTDDHITLSEDELGLLNLLGNDNDLDKDALKIVSVSALFGEVELMPNGQVKYQPPHNFSGQDRITYWLSDGRSNALSGQAYITVNSVNDAPVANNDAATVIANSKITIEVLDNDTDVDGDVLTVKQASAMYGIVLNNGNSIEYQPNMGFDGADVIHYTIADKSGAQSSAQVNMTVLKENKSAPVIIGQKPLFMDEDTTLELTLDHINYTDSDSLHGDIVLELAEGENYTLNGLSLTPKQHFSGELFVPVTLFDAKHRSLEYMLLITVNDVNDSPQAGQILLESVKDEKFTLFMSAMMHDPDITFGPHGLNDPRLEQFKYIFSKQAVREDHGGGTNKGGRFLQVPGAKNGVVEYTPPAGFIGRDHVFFFVYDDKGAVSGRGDIVLDIKEHTSSPVIIRSNTLTEIREDQPFQLSINDLHIRYQGSMNRHSDLTLVVDDTLGPYTYDPVTELITIDPLYEETSLSVFVQVSDGVSNSNTFVVPVSLISVNEAPTVFDLEETVTNLQGIEIDIRSELVVDPEASKSPSLFDQFTYQFVIPEGSIDHKTDGGQFVRVPGKPHGVFKYIPNPNFVKDTVSFWVTDNGGVRSNMGTIVMNAPVPAIPHRPSASLNMGENHVTWTKVDFATHYIVQEHWQWSDFSSSVKEYRSDTNQISLIDKVNGYSKYSIKACHLAACSQWSELSLPTKSFVTTPKATLTESNGVMVNWGSAQEGVFDILVKYNSNEWTEPGRYTSTKSSIAWSSLPSGKRSYKVRRCDDGLINCSDWTTESNALLTPVWIHDVTVNGSSTTLKWGAIPNASYYDISIKFNENEWTLPGRFISPGGNEAGTNQLTFNDADGGIRAYKIRSCIGSIDNAICSAWSAPTDKYTTIGLPEDTPAIKLSVPTYTFINRTETITWAFIATPKTILTSTLYVVPPGSNEVIALHQVDNNQAGFFDYQFVQSGTYRFFTQACGMVLDTSSTSSTSRRTVKACSSRWENEVHVEVINTEFVFEHSGELLTWSSESGAKSFVIESATCTTNCADIANLSWQVLTTLDGDQQSYTLPQDSGATYRIKVCFSDGSCSSWIYPVDKRKRTLFIHTDLLGSPVAETN
ncbi:Ig-like domain-containing protein [Pseudoalteromonas aurantia]|uniref:Tandem-95 repeat protein n=1 Tax=Pseudoalteromonas aurantia 208 TaxID=1314867 RepID=A0ABR9EHE6_9GAMM|nr:tandem-95 repeat protein [Pseudoalteromonas aurantia]MBE0370359.1 hypothetical protein [Pseudoalteromonas aurantia 208]